jgi:hypothetical protein
VLEDNNKKDDDTSKEIIDGNVPTVQQRSDTTTTHPKKQVWPQNQRNDDETMNKKDVTEEDVASTTSSFDVMMFYNVDDDDDCLTSFSEDCDIIPRHDDIDDITTNETENSTKHHEIKREYMELIDPCSNHDITTLHDSYSCSGAFLPDDTMDNDIDFVRIKLESPTNVQNYDDHDRDSFSFINHTDRKMSDDDDTITLIEDHYIVSFDHDENYDIDCNDNNSWMSSSNSIQKFFDDDDNNNSENDDYYLMDEVADNNYVLASELRPWKRQKC